MSIRNADSVRFMDFPDGPIAWIPLSKKRLQYILTSSELAAAIFGASSTENLRNKTASDIIAKPHSPSIHIVAHTTIPFHILDRSKIVFSISTIRPPLPCLGRRSGPHLPRYLRVSRSN
jgi:hypothetical protein